MRFDPHAVLQSVTPLEPDALHLLEQFGTTVDVPRDNAFYDEGDPAAFCYRVLTGCVRTIRTLEDGRRQVGEFLLQGDLFGFDALDTHCFGAEAVTNAIVRRYPRRMVDGLAESRPALARRLRELAQGHLRAAHEQIMLLGRKSATERVASFMLDMEQRCGKTASGSVELSMGRTDIADHLGLTVETVCRVLSVFKRENIVATGRTTVEVRDRRALMALACETRH